VRPGWFTIGRNTHGAKSIAGGGDHAGYQRCMRTELLLAWGTVDHHIGTGVGR
jgi:hypothetical protein